MCVDIQSMFSDGVKAGFLCAHGSFDRGSSLCTDDWLTTVHTKDEDENEKEELEM